MRISGTVVWQLGLSWPSKRGPGFKSTSSNSVCSLHALLIISGDSKWTVNVNASMNGCLSLW